MAIAAELKSSSSFVLNQAESCCIQLERLRIFFARGFKKHSMMTIAMSFSINDC